MTVYAVSRGEYSDYGVLCIFEAKEDAEAYAASLMKLSLAEYRRRAAITDHRERDCLHYDDPRVEDFQYWPRGQLPTAKERL